MMIEPRGLRKKGGGGGRAQNCSELLIAEKRDKQDREKAQLQ